MLILKHFFFTFCSIWNYTVCYNTQEIFFFFALESPRVQVDEKGERVRAVSKRCTIILRDIPPSTDEKVRFRLLQLQYAVSTRQRFPSTSLLSLLILI